MSAVRKFLNATSSPIHITSRQGSIILPVFHSVKFREIGEQGVVIVDNTLRVPVEDVGGVGGVPEAESGVVFLVDYETLVSAGGRRDLAAIANGCVVRRGMWVTGGKR